MKKNKDNIIAIVLAAIMVLFVWHNFKVSGNNVIFVMLFLVLLYFFKKNINKIVQKNERRKNIIIAVISLLFAITEVVCASINIDFTLNHIINKWFLVNLAGYFILAYTIISIIYNKLENKKFKNKEIEILKNKILENDKMLVLCSAALICIAWILYFIAYFPGIISSDSYSQIQQVLGDIPLNNHHPIFHTAIIGIFVNLGLNIFHNINIAVSLYTIFQMITLAILYSFVIRFLKKNGASSFVLIVVLLYYMLYPINATYSVVMWKDILFSGIFPIFTMYCAKMVFDKEKFYDKKRNIIYFIILSVLMIYSRHNGFYVVILTLFAILIGMRKYWKKILPILVTVIIINTGINYCLYNIMNIKKGSIAEAMSIPLQQVARTIKNNDDIDEETKTEFNKFFVQENIWEEYKPVTSDPVKFKLDSEYFDKNKGKFIEIWIKLFLKHPKDYIEATLSNSYGYYYIEASNNIIDVYSSNIDNTYDIKLNPTEDNKLFNAFKENIERENFPVFTSMFKIGTGFWLIIVFLGFEIYKKRYCNILIYIPILILWLTCVASPVYNELRYAYPIFTTLPILIGLSCTQNKEKKEEKT